MGRVLVAAGAACIAVVHPLNSAGKFENESTDSSFVIGKSYLDEFGYSDDIARDGLRMVFHSRHRPLEAYSRALETSGFVIEAIREHRIPEDGFRSDRSRYGGSASRCSSMCARARPRLNATSLRYSASRENAALTSDPDATRSKYPWRLFVTSRGSHRELAIPPIARVDIPRNQVLFHLSA